MDEETGKFYDLVDRIEKLCREKGELPLAEVEEIAQKEGIRATAVLDDIAISEEFTVDYAKGKLIHKG